MFLKMVLKNYVNGKEVEIRFKLLNCYIARLTEIGCRVNENDTIVYR